MKTKETTLLINLDNLPYDMDFEIGQFLQIDMTADRVQLTYSDVFVTKTYPSVSLAYNPRGNDLAKERPYEDCYLADLERIGDIMKFVDMDCFDGSQAEHDFAIIVKYDDGSEKYIQGPACSKVRHINKMVELFMDNLPSQNIILDNEKIDFKEVLGSLRGSNVSTTLEEESK